MASALRQLPRFAIPATKPLLSFNTPSSVRCLSTSSTTLSSLRPRRAMMYVPGSDQRKLRKAVGANIDSVALDLEDSVAIDRKGAARELVMNTLNAVDPKSTSEKLVRINAVDTGLAEDDLQVILPLPKLEGIVIPKVHSAEEVKYVASLIDKYASEETKDKLTILASVESAKAIFNLREICTASPRVDSLLFAAEDYCADLGIRRTKSRLEMLYPRQAIVTAAKAHGLKALDMVCIDYNDPSVLEAECTEGADFGFDGKQCIHPGQIAKIQELYSPSKEAVDRAVKILEMNKEAEQGGKGAFGLEDAGTKIMIDAPVVLQAQAVVSKARAAGFDIPSHIN